MWQGFLLEGWIMKTWREWLKVEGESNGVATVVDPSGERFRVKAAALDIAIEHEGDTDEAVAEYDAWCDENSMGRYLHKPSGQYMTAAAFRRWREGRDPSDMPLDEQWTRDPRKAAVMAAADAPPLAAGCEIVMADAFTTWGPVRGDCGHVHPTEAEAAACIHRDAAGCARQGGYSDRRPRRIGCRADLDGYDVTRGPGVAVNSEADEPRRRYDARKLHDLGYGDAGDDEALLTDSEVADLAAAVGGTVAEIESARMD